jgi:ribose-phosphate pyrophosphokinase
VSGAFAHVLAFDDGERPAAARLAAMLGAPFSPIARHRFPDGECRLTLPAALHGRVLFWRSLDRPNDKLVELMIAAPAARELGASALALVCPYLAYMRQDTAFEPGQAVSQRHVGAFLTSHFETVLTVDPHLHRIASLDAVMPRSRCLVASAAGLLGAHAARERADPLLIGPDAESAPWVALAASAGAGRAGRAAPLDHAVCTKVRRGDRAVSIELPEGLPLAGRAVVLVDDVASTGHTLAAAARRCLERGAASVDAAVVHALLGPDDEPALHAAGIDRIWSTNSVVHPSNTIDLVPLLAGALAPTSASLGASL